MATSNNPNDSSDERQLQLKSVLDQLSSGRASESWRGIDQIKQWLNENPEDREVYELLLDAAQKNRDFRAQARDLLIEMKGKSSQTAEEALSRFSTSANDLLADADDTYYAGEYKQAIDLYRKVLRADPENIRAREQLTKAMFEAQLAIGLNPDLPREALQYFRQARSYIAAKDYSMAVTMLGASIEAAEEQGKTFPDAEQLLDTIQNLIIAEGFKKRAYLALENNQWRDALGLFNRAIALDPTDEGLKKEISNIQELLQAENELRNKGTLKVFIPLGKLQKALETAKVAMSAQNPLLKDIEKQVYQIRLVQRLGISFVVIVALALIFFRGAVSENNSAIPILPETQMPVLVIIVPTTTIINTTVPVVTNTVTATPSIFPTETLSPTSTLTVLGTGYIKLVLVTVRDNPNGKSIETLGMYQIVTILEQKDIGGSTWYKCTWDANNNTDRGWILAEYIYLGIPPTLTP